MTSTARRPHIGTQSAGSGEPAPDRWRRLDDILKLMVADGLVPAAEAERLAQARTRRLEHPLELIARRDRTIG